nr:BPSL0761 family protein [Pseudomonas sp. NFPP33]
MTMPDERSRAVVQTREFLVKDSSLPEKVRDDAKFLLRHFPSQDDVILAGRIEEQSESLPLGASSVPRLKNSFRLLRARNDKGGLRGRLEPSFITGTTPGRGSSWAAKQE